MAEYAYPEMLVSTGWVADRLNPSGQQSGKQAGKAPAIRIIEVDVDPKLYEAGHIPGAVGWNWTTQLQDQVRRDIPSREAFEALLSQAGVSPSDTVVLYGDSSNWFAAYAFWLFKVYKHKDVRLMDGGRKKWLDEEKRPMTTEKPAVKPMPYKVAGVDEALRALSPEVVQTARSKAINLVDVRSTDEFTGKIIAPPGMTETAQRGGHIPGAKSVPWSTAVKPDGTFKSADELKSIYFEQAGVDPKKPTIAYCRIGERSSHTWFVLKYLLGLENVKNYDGSWTEYGNLIGVPIER